MIISLIVASSCYDHTPFSVQHSTAQRKGGGQLESVDCNWLDKDRSDRIKMTKNLMLMMNYIFRQSRVLMVNQIY